MVQKDKTSDSLEKVGTKLRSIAEKAKGKTQLGVESASNSARSAADRIGDVATRAVKSAKAHPGKTAAVAGAVVAAAAVAAVAGKKALDAQKSKAPRKAPVKKAAPKKPSAKKPGAPNVKAPTKPSSESNPKTVGATTKSPAKPKAIAPSKPAAKATE